MRIMRMGSKWLSAAAYLTVAMSGSIFALVIAQAMKLEFRHLVAVVAGLAMLSLGLFFFDRMRDLLLYALAFNLPFTSIEKTFLRSEEVTFVTPGIAVGLADIILFCLYAIWFFRIFVVKDEPLPRWRKLDYWVLAFIACHLFSLLNSVSRTLTLYEIIRLMKYVLLYFYLSRNIRREHLKWMIAGVFFAILLQSALSVYQQRTGNLLGLGRTKGADLDYEQYTVTGFESVRRAEGTTFDSHALGLFFAMTLPISFGLACTRRLRGRYRLAAAATLVLGLPGLGVSFGRAGWLAFVVACLLMIWIFLRAGEGKQMVAVGLLLSLMALPFMLPFAKYVYQRLFEAPPELFTARLETIEMSFNIWKDSPWTGVGANTYMRALQLKYSIFEGDPYFIPAHNMLVFVTTELGVTGLVFFIGLMGAIFVLCGKIIKQGDPLLRVLGAAAAAGFLALQITGLFDPIYITSVTYYLLWFMIGWSAALYRLTFDNGRRTHV